MIALATRLYATLAAEENGDDTQRNRTSDHVPQPRRKGSCCPTVGNGACQCLAWDRKESGCGRGRSLPCPHAHSRLGARKLSTFGVERVSNFGEPSISARH